MFELSRIENRKEYYKYETFYLEGMFYRNFIPAIKKFPNRRVLLMHGSFHNGNYWVSTPDNRKGWAILLAKQGYEVLVPDMPGYGKSIEIKSQLSGELIVEYMTKLLESKPSSKWTVFSHSISGPYGWKLVDIHSQIIENLIAISPGQMGNIQNIPEANNDQISVKIKMGNNEFEVKKSNPAGDNLIKNWFIGQSTQFPDDIDALTRYQQRYLSPTPKELLLERLNYRGSQLKVENGENLSTNILLVGPGHDLNYPLEYYNKLKAFWDDKNTNCQILWLPDQKITGNGHMAMIEKNNQQILAKILTLAEM